MNNRYDHFADDDMRGAERLVNDAQETVHIALLRWQKKMEEQLVKDVLETLEKMLDDGNLSEEEFGWRATSVLKFLVHKFTSGILYAQERLG